MRKSLSSLQTLFLAGADTSALANPIFWAK